MPPRKATLDKYRLIQLPENKNLNNRELQAKYECGPQTVIDAFKYNFVIEKPITTNNKPITINNKKKKKPKKVVQVEWAHRIPDLTETEMIFLRDMFDSEASKWKNKSNLRYRCGKSLRKKIGVDKIGK